MPQVLAAGADGRVEARLKEIIRDVVAEKGAWLVELEVVNEYLENQKDR